MELNRFDYSLVRLARAVVGVETGGLEVVTRTMPRPKCLCRDTVGLVEEALSIGGTRKVARLGWRQEPIYRGGSVSEGRLWERYSADELAPDYGPATLELLLTLTANKPDDAERFAAIPASARSGDVAFAFWAFSALSDGEIGRTLSAYEVFRGNPLCQLAYPDLLYRHPGPVADFAPLIRDMPWAAEVGREPFARGWARAEAHKASIHRWESMRDLGDYQGRVLDAWLAAAGAAGRLDLARFAFDAARRAYGAVDFDPRGLVRSLRLDGVRVADRSEAYRGAAAFAARIETLSSWEQWARGVPAFDDDYAQARHWLATWEREDGDRVAEDAAGVVSALDPMAMAAAAVAGGDEGAGQDAVAANS